jgi:hypothetical protein
VLDAQQTHFDISKNQRSDDILLFTSSRSS